MNKIKSYPVILIVLSIFCSCSSNPLDVDVSKQNTAIQFIEVDTLFFKKSLQVVKSNHEKLKNQLGDLYIYELSQNIRSKVTDSVYKAIYTFYNAAYIVDLEKEKEKLYPKLNGKENQINTAFDYLSFHFGDSIIPQHIFFMNKLFSQVTCSQSEISVGLESYISPESKVIQSIPNGQLYTWQKEKMDAQYLSRDIIQNWIQVQVFEELDTKLAEHIVQAGKILYVLNATFPDASERYILRYSKEDLKWAKENEKLSWDFLVKQQLLFKSTVRDRANFLNEGPTTVGLPEESPDRMGQFLGYQMVKGYMRQNKVLTLPELLEVDYNTILQTYEID